MAFIEPLNAPPRIRLPLGSNKSSTTTRESERDNELRPVVVAHSLVLSFPTEMVKDLQVTCDVLNREGTFAGGDPVTGRVTFSLEKETKVKSVFVKLKGDANVRWSTGTGDKRRTYHAHRRYFKLKAYLVPENAEGLYGYGLKA